MSLGLPNTNNQREGTFTDLKNKLRDHNGLSRKRKEKFINGFLEASALGMIRIFLTGCSPAEPVSTYLINKYRE